MSSPLKRQISLKDFEIVVDDFIKKTNHINRKELVTCIMDLYMDELGHDMGIIKDSRITDARKTVKNCITVPRYKCIIRWTENALYSEKSNFKVHFISRKSEHELPFDKSFAEFLFFYDNPNGLFRLESLSFLFQ